MTTTNSSPASIADAVIAEKRRHEEIVHMFDELSKDANPALTLDNPLIRDKSNSEENKFDSNR